MGQNVLHTTRRGATRVGDHISTTRLLHVCGNEFSPLFPLSFCMQLQRGLIWAQAPNRSNTVLYIFCCVPAHYFHKEFLVLEWGQPLDEEQPFEAAYMQESGYTDGQRKHVEDFKLKNSVDKKMVINCVKQVRSGN